MTSFPGPRTNPTVKPLATTSHKALRSWQVALGPLQLVALLGIILGGMACSFYLGFFSGQKSGIETALTNNLSSVMRLPVSDSEDDAEVADDILSSVYAKLNESGQGGSVTRESASQNDGMAKGKHSDQKGAQKDTLAMARPVPELGTIKTTAEAPLDLSPEAKAQESNLEEIDRALANLNDSEPEHVKVLGGGGVDTNQADSLKQKSLKELRVAKNDKSIGASLTAGGDETAGNATTGNSTTGNATNSETANDRIGTSLAKSAESREASPSAAKIADKKDIPVKETESVAKATTQEKKPTSLFKEVLPKGWFAQVAAPVESKDAEGLASKLKQSGFPVSIEVANVRGQKYYRVLVGPEENRQQAERLISQIKRESYLRTDPFIRMVR